MLDLSLTNLIILTLIVGSISGALLTRKNLWENSTGVACFVLVVTVFLVLLIFKEEKPNTESSVRDKAVERYKGYSNVIQKFDNRYLLIEGATYQVISIKEPAADSTFLDFKSYLEVEVAGTDFKKLTLLIPMEDWWCSKNPKSIKVEGGDGHEERRRFKEI